MNVGTEGFGMVFDITVGAFLCEPAFGGRCFRRNIWDPVKHVAASKWFHESILSDITSLVVQSLSKADCMCLFPVAQYPTAGSVAMVPTV